MLVEIGNAERDVLIFDLGSGSLANNAVFDVTRDAIVARQAQVIDRLPPIAGEQRVPYTPAAPEPPAWWAEARIPLDDVQPPG